MGTTAILALSDGRVFHGKALGKQGVSVGEVIFNTGMSGYQEILSDPSYCRQIVTLTYPHIGNTGANSTDVESTHCHTAGLIVRDYPAAYNNWRQESSLHDWMVQQGVVGISEIDTRALTIHLRTHGACAGCIVSGDTYCDEAAAIAEAQAHPSLSGQDLAQHVSCSEPYVWSEGTWRLSGSSPKKDTRYKVVVYDFGVKHNILRLLADRGCELHVVPARTSADSVLAMQPDGVMLSNGPGDPEPCSYAIAAIEKLLETRMPIFGICLGHQLLALANGAQTEKMKFGHHGINHPVQCLQSKRTFITSQNHGFTVSEEALPDCLSVTHRSLFDNTIQGIEHKTLPAFSFQGHPEASPGPHDICSLFDRFTQLMDTHQ